MVTLSGKKDNGLAYVKKSLEDNLKINPASSRLVDINNSIVNNRYRIKDLDNKSFNTITQGYISYVIDNKLFIIGSSISSWVIEVFDIFTMALITTINTGTQQGAFALTYDAQYIYIPKIEISGSAKNVKIRKYERCSLNFIEESATVFSSSFDITIVSCIQENGFIYIGVVASADAAVIKINLINYTVVNSIAFRVPLYISKTANGLIITGNNTNSGANYRRIKYVDFNLADIQTFPQTSLTINIWRLSIINEDYLYATNDAGILVKYQISTNSLIKEVRTPIIGVILSLNKVKNGVLIQLNNGVIQLYDDDLNLIKNWDYYNTTTTGGFMSIDSNYTLYTHSYKEPKIYKKQFIDMTEGVI